MRVLIAGASGSLGRPLVAHLTALGDEVTTLVRRPAGPGQVQWDPYSSGAADPIVSVVSEQDVVINLAGAPLLGNPHSKRWADAVLASRVTTTRALTEAIVRSGSTPVFLAGNGISWYGDHGAQEVTESASSRGDALLARVTRAWQDAAAPASVAGSRVVILRTSPVLDVNGPPLKQLRLLFRTGLGGPLGRGDQYFPVISLPDWIGAVAHLRTAAVEGPANLCCPVTPTNADFTRALAELTHRPAFFRVPAPVIRAAAGPMAPEVLGSIRAVPRALLDSGFEFADADVAAVLRTGLEA